MATTPARSTSSEATTEAPKSTLKGYVQYIGPAGERILTEEDWETVGAKGQKAAVWNFRNGFKVPADKFNEKALEYLRDADDRFIVVGA